MGSAKLGLMALILSACFIGTAYAQDAADSDDASYNTAPQDYGAGYQMIVIHQHKEHPIGPDVDPGWGPVIKLDKAYPVISSPLTADAKFYNADIGALMPRWWRGVDGPPNNSLAADSAWDISLDCEPVGQQLPVDGPVPANAVMLPGVISISCGSYNYMHGAAHGGGFYWGFNWLVAQHRPIKPLDIFAPNSGWLEALTALVDASRNAGNNMPGMKLAKLDFADTHHWVLMTAGLGLTYAHTEFGNCECGGEGMLYVIPWSKLSPYLRKDGIVPQKYWQPAPASN
jgi:hypothetical protein